MKPCLPLVTVALLTLMPASAAPLSYPSARRADTTDVLHGVTVADPYRWMEDLDSAETVAWVDAQAKFTEDFLSKLPRRTALLDRLKQLQDYDKHGVPHKVGSSIRGSPASKGRRSPTGGRINRGPKSRSCWTLIPCPRTAPSP